MTVNVDEMTTDVEVEPTAPAEASPPSPWEARERTRALLARLAADRARTAAEGFDD